MVKESGSLKNVFFIVTLADKNRHIYYLDIIDISQVDRARFEKFN